MIKAYYELTKPGIIRGNAIVAAAAFMFGSQGSIVWSDFVLMLAGLIGVIAGGCVFNNYADRHIDAKMERTKSRALVTNQIKGSHALIFGGVLFTAGSGLLFLIGFLPLVFALAGFVVYVFFYTPLKPKTKHAVFVGAVAGAMPPLVGYTAASHALDYFALALFLFLLLWQIPHFFAIARFRYAEYAAAGVPLFVAEPKTEKERRQARIIFYLSLVLLLVFCLALILQR